MNNTNFNPTDFLIKVTEIEKEEGQKSGVFGLSKNMISGVSELNNLIWYLFSNSDKYLELDDIKLKRNPFLEVYLLSKKKCSLKNRSEKLMNYLEVKYDLVVDSVYRVDNFIIINSIENLEKFNPEIEEPFMDNNNTSFISKGIPFNEIIRVLKHNYQLKIMVENENLLNDNNHLRSITIPIEYLESEEKLALKLKELGVEFTIEKREFWKYNIKN